MKPAKGEYMGRVRGLYAATVLPCLFIGLLAFALDGWRAIRSHAELDYGEGIVMWQAAHVTQWSQAYHPIERAPYVVFHYPPLYHLASFAASNICRDLLQAGRLVSVLSLTVVAAILGYLCWICAPQAAGISSRALGAVSGALFIFTLPTWPWACLMRVDTFAMLLSFSGLAIFIRRRHEPMWMAGAFLLFVAAFFTKQTMIAAPLACGLILLLENPRQFVRIMAIAIGAAAGALGALQYTTHGYYLKNIVGYNHNVFIPGQLLRFELEHIESSGPVVGACIFLPAMFLLRSGISGLAAHIREYAGKSPFTRLMAVTAVLFAISAVVTFSAGKQGANYNYFLEMDLVCALGAGAFVSWMLHARHGSATWKLALFATLVLLLHCTRVEPRIYSALTAGRDRTPAYSAEIVRILRNTPGRVYSEDMTILMESGKDLEAEPAIITTLALGRQFDETPFVQEIEAGQFAAIIVSTTLANPDRFTPRVADAIRSRYAVQRTVGPYSLYTPR